MQHNRRGRHQKHQQQCSSPYATGNIRTHDATHAHKHVSQNLIDEGHRKEKPGEADIAVMRSMTLYFVSQLSMQQVGNSDTYTMTNAGIQVTQTAQTHKPVTVCLHRPSTNAWWLWRGQAGSPSKRKQVRRQQWYISRLLGLISTATAQQTPCQFVHAASQLIPLAGFQSLIKATWSQLSVCMHACMLALGHE